MAKKEKKGGIWSFAQGEIISADGYRRHSVWIVFLVAHPNIYMCFKFDIQVKLDNIVKLNNQLNNAKTDMIHVSSKYGSMTRESEMVKMVASLHLTLKATDQPPYYLDK